MSAAAIFAATAGSAAISHAATIANGGFETGDLTGWTLTNGSGFDTVCTAGSTIGSSTCVANSGTQAMAFGQFGAPATLSQTIATTPGSHYTITFFLANDNPGGDPGESFAMRWDGATVFSLASPQASFAYSQRVVLNLTATSASTVLAFDAEHDPAQWFLDDVAIADAAAVPEPASWMLTGIGLTGALSVWRKRRAG